MQKQADSGDSGPFYGVGWQAPLGLTEQLIFFVIFFLGVLMVDKK